MCSAVALVMLPFTLQTWQDDSPDVLTPPTPRRRLLDDEIEQVATVTALLRRRLALLRQKRERLFPGVSGEALEEWEEEAAQAGPLGLERQLHSLQLTLEPVVAVSVQPHPLPTHAPSYHRRADPEEASSVTAHAGGNLRFFSQGGLEEFNLETGHNISAIALLDASSQGPAILALGLLSGRVVLWSMLPGPLVGIAKWGQPRLQELSMWEGPPSHTVIRVVVPYLTQQVAFIIAGCDGGALRFYAPHRPDADNRLHRRIQLCDGAVRALQGVLDIRTLKTTVCPVQGPPVVALQFHLHLDQILYGVTNSSTVAFQLSDLGCEQISEQAHDSPTTPSETPGLPEPPPSLARPPIVGIKGAIVTSLGKALTFRNVSIHRHSRMGREVATLPLGGQLLAGDGLRSVVVGGDQGAVFIHSTLPVAPFAHEGRRSYRLFMLVALVIGGFAFHHVRIKLVERSREQELVFSRECQDRENVALGKARNGMGFGIKSADSY